MRRLARLPLRTRLAALVCAAIGIVVLAAALSSYLLVSTQLNHEVDDELAAQATQALRFIQVDSADQGVGGIMSGTVSGDGQTTVGIAGGGVQLKGTVAPGGQEQQLSGGGPAGGLGPGSEMVVTTADCVQNPAPSDNPVVRPAIGTQLVKSDGTRCASPYYATPVAAGDIDVARGALASSLRTGYTDGGQHVRVLTVSAGPGVAVAYIRPLADVDSSLGALAWRLGAVAAAGLAAALLAGLWVARAALRPVRRFTEIVEHVARTDDLGTRVAVTGRDEIARLGVSFNDMTEALESERQRQRRLVSDAGHELRTPLTGLRTAVDLLVRSELSGRELTPAQRRTLLANADAQLGELAQLVDDLLRLARTREADAPAPARTAFHEAAAGAVERARRRAPGVEIAAELEPCYVLADPGGLERAVLNLLDNAVKFSPPGGRVTVRLSGGVCAIADQGPGIAEQDLPRVFDRFWRSDSARALPGSGLGLAIVAQYAARIGGTVSLEAGSLEAGPLETGPLEAGPLEAGPLETGGGGGAGGGAGAGARTGTGTVARLTVPLDRASAGAAQVSERPPILTA